MSSKQSKSKLPLLIRYFEEQLYRELAHMFEWKNMPDTIPLDYLERNLVRTGHVMFFEDDRVGLDVLRATVRGFNRYEQPIEAYHSPNSQKIEEVTLPVERTIKRLTDSDSAIDEFDPSTDCVLISNMAHGQPCTDIVDHYAERLAFAQLAFDTNLLWQNIPYFFITDSADSKLSVQKMFYDALYTGDPYVHVDKHLLASNQERNGVPSGVPFIGKELMDTRNELMMKFRETVGITTAGVDKAERANTLEVTSNAQHTKTVLQIMLEQRQIACDNINAFFGLNTSVNVVGADLAHEDVDGGDENSAGDGGVEEFTED